MPEALTFAPATLDSRAAPRHQSGGQTLNLDGSVLMLRFGIVALLLGLAAPAMAQYSQSQASQEEQQACEPDVYRLCNDYVPDVDRIVACLNANRRALSPACRAVMVRPHRR